ncbi:MAG: dihydrodipicolinate synthase family protein [bacterium]
MKKEFAGVFPVMPTPLKEDGTVDKEGLKFIARRLIEKGVHGVVVMGSTGEFPYLTREDKQAAMEAAVEEAGGKVPVVAGFGAFGTDETLQLCKMGEKIGVDAFLLGLPMYYNLKFQDVYNHYKRIAETVAPPIIYYHFPQTLRLNLEPDEVGRLFEIEKVIGMKESTFLLPVVKRHIEAIKKPASVFSGTSLLLRPMMEMGACGVICPMPCLIPEVVVEMYELQKAGDRRRAKEAEKKVFEALPVLSDVQFSTGTARRLIKVTSRLGLSLNIGGSQQARLKEAMRLLGYPITPLVKSPLPQITEKQKRKIQSALKSAGILM